MLAWLKIGGCALAAGALAWLVDDYAWQRGEVARQRAAVSEALAANRSLVEAAAALEAHHRAVLAALAESAEAERTARLELDGLLEDLADVEPAENCELGPGLRALLDRLR